MLYRGLSPAKQVWVNNTAEKPDNAITINEDEYYLSYKLFTEKEALIQSLSIALEEYALSLESTSKLQVNMVSTLASLFPADAPQLRPVTQLSDRLRSVSDYSSANAVREMRQMAQTLKAHLIISPYVKACCERRAKCKAEYISLKSKQARPKFGKEKECKEHDRARSQYIDTTTALMAYFGQVQVMIERLLSTCFLEILTSNSELHRANQSAFSNTINLSQCSDEYAAFLLEEGQDLSTSWQILAQTPSICQSFASKVFTKEYDKLNVALIIANPELHLSANLTSPRLFTNVSFNTLDLNNSLSAIPSLADENASIASFTSTINIPNSPTSTNTQQSALDRITKMGGGFSYTTAPSHSNLNANATAAGTGSYSTNSAPPLRSSSMTSGSNLRSLFDHKQDNSPSASGGSNNGISSHPPPPISIPSGSTGVPSYYPSTPSIASMSNKQPATPSHLRSGGYSMFLGSSANLPNLPMNPAQQQQTNTLQFMNENKYNNSPYRPTTDSSFPKLHLNYDPTIPQNISNDNAYLETYNESVLALDAYTTKTAQDTIYRERIDQVIAENKDKFARMKTEFMLPDSSPGDSGNTSSNSSMTVNPLNNNMNNSTNSTNSTNTSINIISTTTQASFTPQVPSRPISRQITPLPTPLQSRSGSGHNTRSDLTRQSSLDSLPPPIPDWEMPDFDPSTSDSDLDTEPQTKEQSQVRLNEKLKARRKIIRSLQPSDAFDASFSDDDDYETYTLDDEEANATEGKRDSTYDDMEIESPATIMTTTRPAAISNVSAASTGKTSSLQQPFTRPISKSITSNTSSSSSTPATSSTTTTTTATLTAASTSPSIVSAPIISTSISAHQQHYPRREENVRKNSTILGYASHLSPSSPGISSSIASTPRSTTKLPQVVTTEFGIGSAPTTPTHHYAHVTGRASYPQTLYSQGHENSRTLSITSSASSSSSASASASASTPASTPATNTTVAPTTLSSNPFIVKNNANLTNTSSQAQIPKYISQTQLTKAPSSHRSEERHTKAFIDNPNSPSNLHSQKINDTNIIVTVKPRRNSSPPPPPPPEDQQQQQQQQPPAHKSILASPRFSVTPLAANVPLSAKSTTSSSSGSVGGSGRGSKTTFTFGQNTQSNSANPTTIIPLTMKSGDSDKQTTIMSPASSVSGIDTISSISPQSNSGQDQRINTSTTESDTKSTSKSGKSSRVQFSATVLFDWEAPDSRFINLKRGDVIDIRKTHDKGWWVGRNRTTNAAGAFPGNFVERIIEKPNVRTVAQNDDDDDDIPPPPPPPQ